MRDNTHISILDDDTTSINIEHIPKFDIADYDLNNEKQLKKYLFDIERICRGSYAYKKLVSFLREYVDMNRCAFFENINNLESNRIRIHIHHTPLTLFDIVSTVYTKRVSKREPLNVNLVAKEVMLLHYMLVVGLVPLSETVHELVHNGYVFVPTNIVLGDYKRFIEQYRDYIDPQLMKTLEESEAYSESYKIEDTKVLTNRTIEANVSMDGYRVNVDDIKDKLKEGLDR